MRKRIYKYEPFFHHYYVDEIVDQKENETLLRVKKDDYVQTTSYIRIISLYLQDQKIEDLELHARQMQMMLDVSSEEYEEFEQYLIVDENEQIRGIDLCALIKNQDYENTSAEETSDDELYEVGLYFYDQKRYEEALEYFYQGEYIHDKDCLCILGYMYEKGQGVQQDEEEAAAYYQKAAEYGSVVAACNLGYFYEFGIGVMQDYHRAFEYYKMGEKTKFPRSLFSLGLCYQNGYGCPQDLEKAVEYYKQAALLHHNDALCSLAECYELGVGVEQDYNEAYHYYEEAANQDSPIAMYKLGHFYDLGLGCKQNKQKAFSYYLKAASYHIEAALTSVATCYEFGNGCTKDSEKALEYYLEAGNMDYVHAQYCLGYYYEMHTELDDHLKHSFYWYKKAAHNGDGASMISLGHMYEDGKGVEKNIEKARDYYVQAIEHNQYMGYYYLGVIALGDGHNKEGLRECVSYFEKIKDQYAPAAYFIAMYLKDECQEHEKAIEYLHLALSLEQDPRAYYQLVLYGEKGIIVGTNEMLDYLKQAVLLHYPPAILKYAYYLEKGIYLEKDLNEAYRLYEMLAQMNVAEGYYQLGRWYFYGMRDIEDKELAREYFEQASQQNHEKACFMLGYMYHYGDGVSVNVLLAIQYYKKAYELGYQDALIELEKLEVK